MHDFTKVSFSIYSCIFNYKLLVLSDISDRNVCEKSGRYILGVRTQDEQRTFYSNTILNHQSVQKFKLMGSRKFNYIKSLMLTHYKIDRCLDISILKKGGDVIKLGTGWYQTPPLFFRNCVH